MRYTEEPNEFEYQGQLEAEKQWHDSLCREYIKYENRTYWKVVKILEHHNFTFYTRDHSKKITIIIKSQSELNRLFSLIHSNREFSQLVRSFTGNKKFSKLHNDMGCRYVEITA